MISNKSFDIPCFVCHTGVMQNYGSLESHLIESLAGMTPDDMMTRRDAELTYAEHRSTFGFAKTAGKLLSDEGENEKLAKGEGVALIMLALAPHSASGIADVCPFSTESCRAHCVAFSGNGLFPAVLRARQARTAFLVGDPRAFVSLLVHTLDRELNKRDLAVRLNGFSDIRWERVLPAWFWDRYSDVQFYDYTKHSVRSRPVATMPAKYALTYSVTERSTATGIAREVASGRSVAVVVDVKGGKPRGASELRPLPFAGMVDGDTNDRRFDDPGGSVVALRYKGSLRSGDPLVVNNDRLAAIMAGVNG